MIVSDQRISFHQEMNHIGKDVNHIGKDTNHSGKDKSQERKQVEDNNKVGVYKIMLRFLYIQTKNDMVNLLI